MTIVGRLLIGITALAIGVSMASAGASAQSIKKIKDRGALNCPVPTGGFAGRSEVDQKGQWKGLDVDMCRAIGTAILGSPDKVNFIPISWAQRFPSIQAGEIDIIVMATGWTLSRDTETGLDFSLPYFFSGLQFLVRSDLGVNSPKELDGGTICATTGTTIERQTSGFMRANGMKYTAVTFEKTEETAAAFLAKRCDAIANSAQALGILAASQPDPSQYKIIPEHPLTLEPEAMAVRGGDQEMAAVADWVLTALVEADELKITSKNLDEVIKTRKDDPQAAALLGLTPGVGARLGLRETWAQDVIRKVGSYSEIYNRNLGSASPYKIPAGYNAVYSQGGLLYPLAID